MLSVNMRVQSIPTWLYHSSLKYSRASAYPNRPWAKEKLQATLGGRTSAPMALSRQAFMGRKKLSLSDQRMFRVLQNWGNRPRRRNKSWWSSSYSNSSCCKFKTNNNRTCLKTSLKCRYSAKNSWISSMRSSSRLSLSSSSSSWCFSSRANRTHWDNQDSSNWQMSRRQWQPRRRLSCSQGNSKSQILRVCSPCRAKLISKCSMFSNNKKYFNSRSCKWILEVGRTLAQIWGTGVNRTRPVGLHWIMPWQGYLLIQGKMMESLVLRQDQDMAARRETKRHGARWPYPVLEVVPTSSMLLIRLLLQTRCPRVRTWPHKYMELALQKICWTTWYLNGRKVVGVSKRRVRRSALNPISSETHLPAPDSTKAKINSAHLTS